MMREMLLGVRESTREKRKRIKDNEVVTVEEERE